MTWEDVLQSSASNETMGQRKTQQSGGRRPTLAAHPRSIDVFPAPPSSDATLAKNFQASPAGRSSSPFDATCPTPSQSLTVTELRRALPPPAQKVAGQSAPRTTLSRPRWEDYLTPSEVVEQQLLVPEGVVQLDSDSDPQKPPTVLPPSARTAPKHAPGPFEIPSAPRVEVPRDPLRFLRWTTLGMGILFVWLVFLGARPATHPVEKTEGAPLPAGQYAHWSGAALDLPVLWMVQQKSTVIVRMADGWQEQDRERRVQDLRRLRAALPQVTDFLLVNTHSERMAEIYGDHYHLY